MAHSRHSPLRLALIERQTVIWRLTWDDTASSKSNSDGNMQHAQAPAKRTVSPVEVQAALLTYNQPNNNEIATTLG